MPVDAPDINKKECVISGADLYLVDGLISDAGRLIGRGHRRARLVQRLHPQGAYRIEGKKTMGLEVAEQLEWRLPTRSSTRRAAASA